MSKARIYTPNSNDYGNIFTTWATIIRNLVNYRELVYELAKVELMSEFKKSFLGAIWIILSPLLVVLVWLLMRSAGLFNPGDTGVPYPVYILLSTSIWGLFAATYKSVSSTISTGGKMFLDAKFPHEVIVAQKVLIGLFNFSITFVFNLFIILFFGVELTALSLLFPLAMIPLAILAITLGLIFAILRIVSFDIYNFFDKGLPILMYLTPVVYSNKVDSPLLQEIIKYNPLTYLVSFPRDILISNSFYKPEIYLICSAVTLLFFFITVKSYTAAEPKVMERLTI